MAPPPRTAPSALIRRPRTTAALSRPRLSALEATGMVLVGPSGAGKTVLAAQMAAEAPRAGWVRLAPGWNGGAGLVALAAAALDGPPPPKGAGPTELAGHLVELLDDPVVLVIDDYHEAVAGECDPLLAETLPLLAPGSTVVLCTRVRPAGLVGRATPGTLRLVAPTELSFTPDEAVELFATAGGDPAVAQRACAELGGWAAGLNLAATVGYPLPPTTLAEMVLGALGDGQAVEAMAVLPYLTAGLAEELGVGDREVLVALAARSMLVIESGDEWRLSAAAAQAVAPGVPEELRLRWRRRAAGVLEPVDPTTAVDLLVADGHFDEAVAVSGRHLSEIPPDRAVPWLYRLPADVRRRFPPVLAGGRATVDLDAATATATEAVHAAPDDASRRQALFGLGSAHLHAGRLSEAAAAFEAAGGPGSTSQLAAASAGWLGAARWWAGDLGGAAAAVAGAAADRDGPDPIARWVHDEVRLARGEPVGTPVGPRLGGPAVEAKARLLAGDPTAGRPLARQAYEDAVAADGFALAVAGPVEAWYLLGEGDLDAAASVADLVRRRIGRHDAFASLHAWLVHLAVARARADAEGVDEATARVVQLRRLGFAPVEAQVRQVLGLTAAPDDATGLEVDVLGPLAIRVDGSAVDTGWRSLKALEVLACLAVKGERGAHREEVIEAVWPDRDPEKGRMLLRAALSEIRRRLEPGRQTGEPSRFLTTVGDRIRLEARVDVAALAGGDAPGDSLPASALRGDLLEEMPYAEWAFDDRRALSTRQAELAERTARDAGAPSAARAAALEFLIAREPWRAELYDRLCSLHQADGNEAAARSVQRRRAEATG